MNRFHAFAPSNIAIVKYMGKADAERNLPANPSLSMTLDSLRSYAEFEELPSEAGARSSEWRAEAPGKAAGRATVPALSEARAARILRQLERVRERLPEALEPFGLSARADRPFFALRTANTFPQASGIASSASSFAAVTLAAAQALCRDPERFACEWSERPELRRRLARMAREGSGSACRSFEGPWVEWRGESSAPVRAALPPLAHFVLVIAAREKSVPSSEAHRRVLSSPLWAGRVARAGERVEQTRRALAEGDLRGLSRIAWAEMWEMHSLFHTSPESFSYFAPGTVAALEWLRPAVFSESDPCAVVTLDAGPNVHLIIEASRRDEWRARLGERFPEHELLEDAPGSGAGIL